MKIITCFLVSALFILPSFLGCAPAPESALVAEVIDGDTITLEGGFKIRYIGVDTPELYPKEEPLAREALEANRALVEGKRVRLEPDVSDKDRYGRLLRYVYVDGKMVNAELVKLGLAEAKAYPPDTKYQSLFDGLESGARSKKLGIWAQK